MFLRFASRSNAIQKIIRFDSYNRGYFVRTVTSSSSWKSLAVRPAPKHDWDKAVSEAEKIVGYPTSFLSMRWLMSDEIANVTLHLRKLVGSHHPLLKTAKNLIFDSKSNMQAWGLIVLLLSKASGHSPNIPEMEHDKSAGILHSQRNLAEITEMIRTSHLIHNGMVNLQSFKNCGNDLSADSELIFGNKMALLGGDYLLGTACLQLAELRNQDVHKLITSSVRDLTESNFIGDRDDENNPLPSDPSLKINIDDASPLDYFENTNGIDMNVILGHPEREWSFRHTLASGSLLGKSCKGALKLAGLSEELQQHGYTFGKHLALAWQTTLDLEPFLIPELPFNATFNLVSAPVLYQLDYDPSLYDEIRKGKKRVDEIDFKKVHAAVLSGPGVEKTKELQRKHGQAAMDVLNKFPDNDATKALRNITLAICWY